MPLIDSSVCSRAELPSLKSRELQLLGILGDAERRGDEEAVRAITQNHKRGARTRLNLKSQLIAKVVMPVRTVGTHA